MVSASYHKTGASASGIDSPTTQPDVWIRHKLTLQLSFTHHSSLNKNSLHKAALFYLISYIKINELNSFTRQLSYGCGLEGQALKYINK